MNFPKCKSCGKKTNKHYEPPLLKNLGKIDDHLSKGRQLGAKICKYGLELWDHGPCAATAIVRLLLVDDSLMPKLSHAEIVVNEN